MRSYFGARGRTLNLLSLYLIMMPTFLVYGYNLSVAGGLLTLAPFYTAFPILNTVTTTGAKQHFNATIQGTIVALYTIGAMFGSLTTSHVGDFFGRRKMIFFGSVFSMIGAIIMSSSFSLAQFIVGRLVTGFAVGTISGSVPVYQTEISSAKNRGAHVAFTGFFITSGILIGYWIDFGCSYITNSASWRVPLAVQISMCIISASVIFFLPESPRWLIKRGRVEEAKEILAIFNDVEKDDPIITEQVNAVTESLELMSSGSFRDLLSMGESRIFHRVLLALFAMFTSQICGINAITFYAPTIFQQYLGMGQREASLLSGCIEIVQPIAAYLAIITVDRFGRRKLLLTAGIGMGISMAVLAGTTSQTENPRALHAAIAFLFIVNIAYSYGFLGCCFLYAAEVSPMRVRSYVSGIAVCVTWSTNFLVVEVTPIGFNTIGYQYYIVYAAINFFLICPVVYFFCPETSNRSLEEIDEIFLQADGFFNVVKVANSLPYRKDMPPSEDSSTDVEGKAIDVTAEYA
jgi:sugar porter (SP) family MFS transporter